MTDVMQKRFFSYHSIEVVIPDHQDWVGGKLVFEDNSGSLMIPENTELILQCFNLRFMLRKLTGKRFILTVRLL